MKNKVISILLLLLSLFAFGINFNSARAYYYISKGNSFFKNENFEEARKNYELSLKLKDNLNVKKNIIKSFYEEKKYKEVIENESDEFFLRGNSYAFLGDSLIKENPEEAKKNYRLALEEYKKAMKQSDDINIKKNYEIVLKKIEDLEKEQQQNQDNQNKQDKQQENKDNNQQNQNNQNNQNNKDNQEQNQETNNQNNQDKNNQNDQQQNNNDSNKQDQKDKSQDNKQENDKQNSSDNNNQKDNNNQDQQNNQNDNNQQDQQNKDQQQNQQDNQNNNDQQDKQNQNNSGENQENSNQPQDKNQGGGVSTGDIKDSKEDIKKNEIGVILKRLEGNEKQSFKNNERVMNIETGNSNNKW